MRAKNPSSTSLTFLGASRVGLAGGGPMLGRARAEDCCLTVLAAAEAGRAVGCAPCLLTDCREVVWRDWAAPDAAPVLEAEAAVEAVREEGRPTGLVGDLFRGLAAAAWLSAAALAARGFLTAAVAEAPTLVLAAAVDLAAAEDSLFTAEVSAVFCTGLTLARLEESVAALAAAVVVVAAGLGAALVAALGATVVFVAAGLVAAGLVAVLVVAAGFAAVLTVLCAVPVLVAVAGAAAAFFGAGFSASDSVAGADSAADSAADSGSGSGSAFAVVGSAGDRMPVGVSSSMTLSGLWLGLSDTAPWSSKAALATPTDSLSMAAPMLATDADDIGGFSWDSRSMSRLGRAEESREPESLTRPMTPFRSMATKLLRTLLRGRGEPLRAN